MDEVDQIMAYEAGELDKEGVIKLFQSLVNSGLAWRLQGHYGRMAQELIQARLVKKPRIPQVAGGGR